MRLTNEARNEDKSLRFERLLRDIWNHRNEALDQREKARKKGRKRGLTARTKLKLAPAGSLTERCWSSLLLLLLLLPLLRLTVGEVGKRELWMQGGERES